MLTETFGESVRGASHMRSETVGQDSYKIVSEGNVLILSVADGHGSKQAVFSKDGSQIAVDVFCRIMQEYVRNYNIDKFADSEIKGKIASIADNLPGLNLGSKTDELIAFLNREGSTKVAQTITEEWKREVLQKHAQECRRSFLNGDASVDEPLTTRAYGSTLLGLMIAEDFIFAFQLGDGDIVRIDDNELESVIVGDKILGVETHSIGKPEAWKSALSRTVRINKRDHLPYAYFLTSDGFANSYPSQEGYEAAITDYFNTIKEHGSKAVKDNLADWLIETSEKGCGDDTTMVISYYADENAEVKDE
jgi:serine/threonine protein phosphatase PrpC